MLFKRALVICGYAFLAAGMVAGTFALVAYGNDYSYDFKTGQIIQNGHVIINSIPNGVRVEADGKLLKKRTPYRAAYRVGEHTFALMRDGFWPWKKTFDVVAGQVTLARYVILVPKEPKRTVLDTRPSVLAQSISKDHRHLAYITGGEDAGLYTVSVGSNRPSKIFAAPLATQTSPAEALVDVVWSDDASRLLVVTTAAGRPVHRLMAADGSDVVNLTTRYGFDFSGLQFSSTNWRQLYWISPDGLRRLDVGAQSVSAVLAEQVVQFWVQENRVFYAQQTPLGRSLWSLDSAGRRQEVIQVLADSDSYSVTYARYRGTDYLAVVPSKTGTGTLYRDIFTDTPVAQTIAQGVDRASFSPDAFFVAFTAAEKMVVYDLERSTIYARPVSYTVTDQPGKLVSMSWYDNHHIVSNRDGKLYLGEFDGNYLVELGPAYGAFPGYSTADLRSIVTYRAESDQVRIVQLLIKQ